MAIYQGNKLVSGDKSAYIHAKEAGFQGTEAEFYNMLANVQNELEDKADADHNHNNAYDAKGSADYALASAKSYTDDAMSYKADADHNHDSNYDSKGSADYALASAQSYTDSAVSQKTKVQIITWGADD